ncbi:MAG: anaerobic ribonucleoside-triphosphate reductase activating protein [Elusimicrobia bacterium]|nr:anaerobic ribonucleoside-triphosphate reductase activating protein [Elusimicrobiota bacterium]
MGELKIKKFITNSLIEWEGRISAVIVVGGCNFVCPFCHNRVLVKANAASAAISQDKVLQVLQEKKDWLDGVVISGGEPCLNHELFAFIKKVKALGFPIKIDTNGYQPRMLETLIKQKLVDYVAMDIKAPLNDKYKLLSGTNLNLNRIKQSIALLRTTGIDYEFRTTYVPSLLEKNDLVEIAAYLQGSKRFYIQQFSPEETLDHSLSNLTPYPMNYLRETELECRKYVTNSRIR